MCDSVLYVCNSEKEYIEQTCSNRKNKWREFDGWINSVPMFSMWIVKGAIEP